MTDRPPVSGEPSTRAGQMYWQWLRVTGRITDEDRGYILAIEAEAAQGAAPLTRKRLNELHKAERTKWGKELARGIDLFAAVIAESLSEGAAPRAEGPPQDLDEVKRQNVAEFLNREAMKRDHPERLVLADALWDMRQYKYEDKYAAAFGLLSRLAASGVVVRAAPRAEGLDVERLARALHVNVGDRSDYDECPQTLDGWHRKTAEILAAEYARLSRPSDERVP